MKFTDGFKSTLVLSLATLAGCGGQSKSQAVGVQILPQNPIVFTAPITYTNNGGTQVTVSGPWMRFQLGINTPSDSADPVTVIHVNVQASGVNSTGQFTTVNADFDPSGDSYSDVAGDTCTYSDYGEFDPSGSATGGSDGKTFNSVGLFELPTSTTSTTTTSGGTTSTTTTSGGCITNHPVFYVGGLPAALNGSITSPGTLNTYSFTVMITPQGWFGSRTNPTDRFQKSVYTSTQ